MIILFWLTLGCIAIAYWFDTAKARESAIYSCKKACREMDYLLLDDSVVRNSTRFGRSASGQFCLLRNYHFEYTISGEYRRRGHITLAGNKLRLLNIDDPNRKQPFQNHCLILSTPFSKDSDAVRTRTEKKPDCNS